MPDSWIDREEFDELVKSFTKKGISRRRTKSSSPESDSQAPCSDAAEVVTNENPPDFPSDYEEGIEEDSLRGYVDSRGEELLEDRDPEGSEEKTNVVPSEPGNDSPASSVDPEVREPVDVEHADEGNQHHEEEVEAAGDLEETGPVYLMHEVSGLSLSTPLRGGNVGEGEDYPTENSQLFDDLETPEVDGGANAENDEVIVDSPDPIESFEAQDVTSDKNESSEGGLVGLLGEAAVLAASDLRTESERDADKAVKALADARSVAEQNDLIKRPGEAETSASQEMAFGPKDNLGERGPSQDRDAETSEDSESKPDTYFSLGDRIDEFCALVAERLKPESLAVVDDRGFPLSDGGELNQGSSGFGVALFQANSTLSSHVFQRPQLGVQLCQEDGIWICLIAAEESEFPVIAEITMERPLELSEIKFWSQTLSSAVQPAELSR